MAALEPVKEPFPIYAVNGRYILFDVNGTRSVHDPFLSSASPVVYIANTQDRLFSFQTKLIVRVPFLRCIVVSHVRATHHMCGCLSGTLPQIPQQNVFLGLPLELMTEDAALLVEKGAGFIVGDKDAHHRGLKGMAEEKKKKYLAEREEACMAEALAHQKVTEERRAAYLRDRAPKKVGEESAQEEDITGESEFPFAPAAAETRPEAPATSKALSLTPQSLLFYPIATITPKTFHSLPSSIKTPAHLIPRPDPSSYSIYKHLHSAGYFLSPGLRFGCQFMAYPGDPLRFHSHFITRGLGWDEEIDLIDIVGGGRLGTGVKKAWTFGGKPSDAKDIDTRVFCVEWGGF